jgi:hypothetical protein
MAWRSNTRSGKCSWRLTDCRAGPVDDLGRRYTYRVFWNEPDRCFVAAVAEWLSLSWAADTLPRPFQD